MSRKSPADDIFDILTKVPWWIGVIAASVCWGGGFFVSASAPAGPTQESFAKLGRWFCNLFAIICLVAAVVSAIKQLFRRRLLDHQADLQSLRTLSWQQFEQLVGEAYRRQGYDVEETGGGGADGGIDLVLRGHGETILVQCKQWRVLQVGVDKVRELFGVLTSEGATRAIMVTSGNFTNDAKSFKVGKPLTLVDGPALATLVQSVRTPSPGPVTLHRPAPRAPANVPSAVSQPPSDASPPCPKCGAPMVLRSAKRGANAGNSFYGCPRYPECKGTRNI
jgi:restriction system protein